MINFMLRYLMPYKWRWTRFMKDMDKIQRVRRDRNPYYIGIPTEELLVFHAWLDELIKDSREYWRV